MDAESHGEQDSEQSGGSSEEDVSDEERSSPSEDGDDEDAQQMREKIADALKANGMDSVADDETDGESDEELMDDEQMMAVDEHLAEIFRSRKDERKSKKGLQLFLDLPFISLTFFRGRRSTRSNPLQEQGPRPFRYLCQERTSKSAQHPTYSSSSRPGVKEWHG